jgi:hypothetical protein
MSDPRFTAPDMTEALTCYDVTITADRDGGDLPNTAESGILKVPPIAAGSVNHSP